MACLIDEVSELGFQHVCAEELSVSRIWQHYCASSALELFFVCGLANERMTIERRLPLVSQKPKACTCQALLILV